MNYLWWKEALIPKSFIIIQAKQGWCQSNFNSSPLQITAFDIWDDRWRGGWSSAGHYPDPLLHQSIKLQAHQPELQLRVLYTVKIIIHSVWLRHQFNVSWLNQHRLLRGSLKGKMQSLFLHQFILIVFVSFVILTGGQGLNASFIYPDSD